MKRAERMLSALILCVLPVLPAAAQVSIIGDLSQDHEARPGQTYDGSILIKNDSPEPQQAKVYQSDYLFSYDGTSNYADPGSTPRSNARWIAFSPSFVVVPPGGTASVNYTVAVPESLGRSAPAGSYWSMLMVEGIPSDAPESSLKKNDRPELGLRQTLRYGIQIATHIAGTGKRSVKFLGARLMRVGGVGTVLQVDVENNGTLWFRPEVYVELFDAAGTSHGKFAGQRFRMYPGTSVRQQIDLHTIPAGKYKALVVVDAGGDDVFGAQYMLEF